VYEDPPLEAVQLGFDDKRCAEEHTPFTPSRIRKSPLRLDTVSISANHDTQGDRMAQYSPRMDG